VDVVRRSFIAAAVGLDEIADVVFAEGVITQTDERCERPTWLLCVAV